MARAAVATGPRVPNHVRDAVVAAISKQWFAADFMYGVAIAPGQDEILMFCIAIAIDEKSESDRH